MSGRPLDGGRPVVVREYQADAPAGLIGDWLSARGIAWRASRPAEEPTVGDAAAIVALGSSASAYWTEPEWISRECELLGAATTAGTPVLGICFGAQALARALGGDVQRAAQPEVGWVTPASAQAQLRGPYLAWHFDQITLPPGAEALAHTPAALQAYTRGSAMGLQFHPEVTTEIWRDWAEHDPAALAEQVPEPSALAAEIAATAPATRARTFALLDWWRDWLAATTA